MESIIDNSIRVEVIMEKEIVIRIVVRVKRLLLCQAKNIKIIKIVVRLLRLLGMMEIIKLRIKIIKIRTFNLKLTKRV
jgi:hypothetical protein